MTIRNQDERTNAIWRFAAISAPFAALLFFGGLSSGNTFSKYNKQCDENLQEMTLKVATYEGKLAQIDSFFVKSDSLLKVFEARFEELDGKSTELTSDNIDGFNQLDMERIEANFEMTKAMKILETEFSTSNQMDRAMQSAMDYLKKYISLYNNRLDKRIRDMRNLASSGLSDALKEEQAKLAEEREKLEEEKTKSSSETKMEALQKKYDDCKDELLKCQTSAKTSTASSEKIGVDYSQKTAKIIGEVETIKKQIIPRMPEGLFGGKKSLKDELRGSLDIIVSTAKDIK